MSKTLILIGGLIIAMPLSVICAAFAWKTYPLKMSRSQKYHTSEWDYVKNRVILTISAFAAPLFVLYLAYCSL